MLFALLSGFWSEVYFDIRTEVYAPPFLSSFLPPLFPSSPPPFLFPLLFVEILTSLSS